MRSHARTTTAVLASLLAGLLALGGCAVAPPVADDLVAPIEVRTLGGAPEVRDARSAFRATFCSTLRAEGVAMPDDPGCDRWLWRLADEPARAGTPREDAGFDAAKLDLVLVTGAFSECVGASSRPFSVGAARLAAAGSKVRTIVVGGRSGTDYNAGQIAAALAASPTDAQRKVILVGYSKGTLDILHFLVGYPALAAGVDAVVGVASPVFGTPLAELGAPAYEALAAKLPNSKCPPGDGEVIGSLTAAATTDWLQANPLPADVRFYSLAAFTTREHVGRALLPFWKHLGKIAGRNDGQVIPADAVIPGSALLGYANADHWGIAQTIETDHPILVARHDPTPFPLEQLFVSLVAFVAADLAGDGAGTAPRLR